MKAVLSRLSLWGRLCLVVIAAYFALAVYGEVQYRVAKARDVTPAYNVVHENRRYQPPSAAHWMGTDNLGRDVSLRLVQGARIAFHVGIMTSLIAIPLGVMLGLLGGYFGGKVDSVVVWLCATVASMPGLLFILAISLVVGQGLLGIYLGIGLTTWVGVCRTIRAESKTPIIMLTAKSETEDKVMGLKQGADDYITKPFEMKEVLARIEAVLRRSGIEPEKASRRLTFDKLTIDMDAFELTVDGRKVPTPPKEMELLYHLASTPNRVYTRNQLLDEVWGFDYFGDTRTVDVHIKRLREKLEGVSEQWELKTVWSVGYKFEVSDK